jgi:hypothetical protein
MENLWVVIDAFLLYQMENIGIIVFLLNWMKIKNPG